MFPVRNFNFLLEIDGAQIGCSDVSGFDAKVNEIRYREGSDPVNTVRRLPGLMEYGQVVLKRGTDTNNTLSVWISETGAGRITKKTVTLTAFGDDKKPAAIWKIINAWPVTYSISDFSGMGNDVVFESLTLAHEGMTRDM